MMKKYFSSGFFLKFKSKLSGFQRTQPELLGVSERKTAHETKFVNQSLQNFPNDACLVVLIILRLKEKIK